MKKFTLHEPNSIPEAIGLLELYDQESKLIAGGTDLIVELKGNKRSLEQVISLRNISGLDIISCHDSELRIGSMVTLRSIEKSEIIHKRFPLLVDAAASIGSIQVRNLATIGGNICNGAPSADTAAPFLAMGAKLIIAGRDYEKAISFEEFLVAPGQTALTKHEILKEIVVPFFHESSCSKYIKYSRRQAMDLPLIGVAVIIVPDDKKEVCQEARIALSLAGPVPRRIYKAEQYVVGKPLKLNNWEKAGELAESESSCRTSFRTTAEYRRGLIRALIPKAADNALQRINVSMQKG